MVAERVRMGLLSAERARNHPERSMLVRSIGQELIVSVDRISIPLLRGDRLILCSDGLHGVLRDNEIEQMTRDSRADRRVPNAGRDRQRTRDGRQSDRRGIHDAGGYGAESHGVRMAREAWQDVRHSRQGRRIAVSRA